MTRRSLLVIVAAAATLSAQGPSTIDPFRFFTPTFAVSSADRARLDQGEVIVRIVGGRGHDLAILSAARIDVDGDRLVAWVHRIADLKKSPYVTAIRRFSHPPRIEDLSDLTLERDDLEDLRGCRSGDCGVKLNDAEIADMRQAIARAGAGWRTAAQEAFRQLVLARTLAFVANGFDGRATYHDRRDPVSLDGEFGALLDQSGFLAQRLPQLADHLKRHPLGETLGVDSFLYWSKEALGRRPVISVTHVSIVRHDDPALPRALVASRQVYATHYLTGSLAITAIVGNSASQRYLVYLNRSRLDVLEGLFGGLVRRIVERRLKDEAADVVEGLRRRLESGAPEN